MHVAVAAGRGRTLVVVPTDADVETMTADARFFVSALEGLSGAELERAVLPFPSHEVDPYRGLAPHFDIASARARALHAVLSGQARLVVASAAALVPRVSAPARLRSASLTLTPGQDMSPIELGDLLAGAGYTRQDPADATSPVTSYTVTIHGEHGLIRLGDLQRSASRVLETLTHTLDFAELADEQGVPGITVQPYTQLFADQLITYVTTSRGPIRR